MCQLYNFAFFDEASKREIRRAIIKGVSIPGHQIPFASREMPIGRGWGTGGLQITLALIGQGDVLKVIDQGADDSVNAVNIKKLVVETTDVEVTEKTQHATLVQSRHRIPEQPLSADQILVLQVPMPEPCEISSQARQKRACFMPRQTTPGRGWGCLTRSCAMGIPSPTQTTRVWWKGAM